jgi:outer membrane protein OmpA-like peptidoglycan-associated protein
MRILLTAMFLWPLSLAAQGLFDSLYVRESIEVYFPFAEAQPDDPSLTRLDSFIEILPEQAHWSFLNIEAHTDSIGNARANERLAQRRAATVRNYLLGKNIPEDRLRISAYGERKPAASNDTEEGRQKNRRAFIELWSSVPMATVDGYVRDAETGKGIETTVFFRSKTRSDSSHTDTSGRYQVRLPKDSIVKIETIAEGYFFESFMTKVFGSPELFKKYKMEPNIELPPAKVGEKAVVRDLFFVGNQAVLLPISEPELPKVLRFMQVNGDLRIEIAGHINHPGVKPANLDAWEWELSVNRAKLVYDYLVDYNISEARMEYKGYGNKEMLYPEMGLSEKEYQQNRRVEIRILGKLGEGSKE